MRKRPRKHGQPAWRHTVLAAIVVRESEEEEITSPNLGASTSAYRLRTGARTDPKPQPTHSGAR